MAKIGVAGAGGHNEVIVGEFLLGSPHSPAGKVKVEYFFEKYFNILVSSEDPTDGGGDFCWRKAGRGDLVQQWLKGVVILAIHDGDLYVCRSQFLDAVQASKAGSDDHHARGMVTAIFLVHDVPHCS